IVSSRITGMTTKKRRARTSIGAQKSGLLASWRRSLRATAHIRAQFTAGLPGLGGNATSNVVFPPEAPSSLAHHEVELLQRGLVGGDLGQADADRGPGGNQPRHPGPVVELDLGLVGGGGPAGGAPAGQV